jgi:hypothetical protein
MPLFARSTLTWLTRSLLLGSSEVPRVCQGNRARRQRRAIRPLLRLLEDRTLLSAFYTYKPIAVTGQTDQNGKVLTALSPDPSINDAGKVAFVGTYADGQGILVGDGITLTNINPAFSHSANRTFSPYVEINNNNQVVAIDRDSTDASSYVRTWSTTPPSTRQDDAIAVPGSPPFDSILASPSINNSGLTVFPATQGAGADKPDTVSLNEHATGDSVNSVNSLLKPMLTAPQALRPQMDQNGDVVLQEGTLATSPIVRIDSSGYVTTIATATGSGLFTALGRSPGISADGQIVVFSGTVSAQGLKKFGVPAGTNAVFASIHYDDSTAWILVPISYYAATNGMSASPITDINLNATVSANATQATQRAVTVAYDGFMGSGSNKVEGIYTSRLNFIGSGTGRFDPKTASTFVVGMPTVVVQIGEHDLSFLGTVTGFGLFQSVNSRDRGDVAFWVTDGTNQAIVRARYQEVVWLDFNPTSAVTLTYAQQMFAALKAPALWFGGLASIFTTENRPDLASAANTIQNDIVNDVHKDYGNVGANILVMGRTSDTLPVSQSPPQYGPYTRVLIGDGPNSNQRPIPGAQSLGYTLLDPFNSSVFPFNGQFQFVQRTPLVFADNIFRSGFYNGQTPIDLSYQGAGEISQADVENAVSEVVAHELGHNFGLDHLGDPTYVDPSTKQTPYSGYVHYIMHNGTVPNELRSPPYPNAYVQTFAIQALALNPGKPDFYGANDTQNDQTRLAFALGSNIDPAKPGDPPGTTLQRDPPGDTELKKLGRVSYKLAVNLSAGPHQVADAVIAVAPPDGVDGEIPEFIDLGAGDLSTLLDRSIPVQQGDQVFLVASTTGQGIDLFSVGDASVDPTTIDMSDMLHVLADPRIRGNLFDGSGMPVIGAVTLTQMTAGGPVAVGQLGVTPAAGAVTAELRPSNSSPIAGQPLTVTATISPVAAGGPTPTGTVLFQLDGNDIGTAVAIVNGLATSGSLTLTAGPHPVQAVYSGDATYATFVGSLTISVASASSLQAVDVVELTPPNPGPLQIAVDFNEALQPASAQTVFLYKVVRTGASSLPIQSAVYTDNGTEHRVVLTIPAGTPVVPSLYHVYIDAANLTATNGDQGAPKTDQLWVDVTAENTLKPIIVQPDGSFAVSGMGQFLGYAPPKYVVAGNFTGSGYTDLIVNSDAYVQKVVQGNTVNIYDPILLLKNNGDGTYAPPVPIAFGGAYEVQSIASVDWNHDGVPDLVAGVASNRNQYLVPQTFQYFVLLNDGHGNFTNAPETPIPVSTNTSLKPFAVYDLNGDGQWEIVHPGALSSANDQVLEVIGKDPNLGYAPQMELPMGINKGGYDVPQQLYFADLNGDGKPDIISQNTGYYKDYPGVSVLLSTPTGYATGQEILQPEHGPLAMGIGPFTGSGQKDIAVVYDKYNSSDEVYDGDVIQVLKNDGKGNFTALDPIVLGRRDVVSASFADVNKDGIPDLVMILSPFVLNGFTSVSQLSVWTLAGDGHGGFTPTTAAPLPLNTTDQSAPTTTVLTDLDGDGYPDLVLGSNQLGEVRLAINDGTGSMRLPTKALPDVGVWRGDTDYGTYALNNSQQVFADFNNDGQADFVTTSAAGLAVYLGQSDGTFRHTDSLPSPFPHVNWVKVGDLNNDGIPDIVFGDSIVDGGSRGMAVYLGNGDGTFRQAPTFIVAPPGGYDIGNVTLADVNHDGKLDAVATLDQQQGPAYAVAGFGIFFGDGKGGLNYNANAFVAASKPGTYTDLTSSATLGDFNGDGKLDLLVPTHNSDGTFGLTDYLGNGTFTPGPIIYSSASRSSYAQILVGDLNGDGKQDLVIDGADESGRPTATIYLGDGHGGFQQASALDLFVGQTPGYNLILPSDLALGDFNGDGHLDLAVSYYDNVANPNVLIYPGDGTGHFGEPQSVTVGDNPFTLVSIPRAPFLDAGAFAVTDQPPTAKDQTSTVIAGSSVTIPVLDNATNPDGAPLTITQVANPAHGAAHIAAGPPDNPADEVIVYAPTPGFTGIDTFTYTIADPAGVESTGSVTVTVQAVKPSATSIAAVSGRATYAGAATLTATLTVGGSPLPGKTITFTLTERGTVQTAGTATTDAHGVATLTGASLGSLSAGTYPGAVTASFGGDASDASSTGSGDLTIARATSTLAVQVASGTYGTTVTFAATLTAAGVPLAREPVTFFTVTASGHTITFGSATTDAHGLASLSGVSLGFVPAGTYTGAIFASFAGDASDAAATGQGDLIITQATPSVTWAMPADITQGQALGAAQLDAKASVPGTFAYSPPAGTVLPLGMSQTLTAVFTPADAIDYKSVQVGTTLNVLPKRKPTPIVTLKSIRGANVRVGTEHKAKEASAVVLQFSGALNQSKAQNIANYSLLTGTIKKNVLGFNTPVPLASAIYDPAAHTVTLVLQGKHTLPKYEQLTIRSGLLTDSLGRPIDGGHTVVVTVGRLGQVISQAATSEGRTPSAAMVDALFAGEPGFSARGALERFGTWRSRGG